MAAAVAIGGLAARKLPLGSSSSSSYNLPEKLPAEPLRPARLLVVARKERQTTRRRSIRVLKSTSTSEPLIHSSNKEADPPEEEETEALLALQKMMLEKQWNLSRDPAEVKVGKTGVVRTGASARERRRRMREDSPRKRISIDWEFARKVPNGYMKGQVKNVHFSRKEVKCLSDKVKFGVSLENLRERFRVELGCKPSNEQMASYLRISCAELQSKLTESSLARDILALGHIGLIMSIARKYDNLGVEMSDLIQGGFMGLLRGIEKFDPSKGYKISTYVYWWIRLGVSKELHTNTRALMLSSRLHARLFSIRTAKAKLEEQGITPSIEKIAETLNISRRKVLNATKADRMIVYSLDREAFPSLNGIPTDSFQCHAADNRKENDPWLAFKAWSLKDEVHRLLDTVLNERERDIICLYHGLKNKSLTWEDIGKRLGLSREGVRKAGIAAMDKLRHAAREKRLEAMLMEQ